MSALLLASSTVALAAGPGYGLNRNNTVGWTLMTVQERNDFQQKIHASKTFDECKVIQTEHHAQMEVRAKEKGLELPPATVNACDRMKARGFIQ
ncbi:hypothetical protein RA876_01300 [Rhodoferax antarcticus]|nr:hypothetical protein RA876_01300 [Rhodoferax antarcticus]